MNSNPKISNSPDQIRVLSVDDHALIREEIAAVIANQKDMRLVAEPSNGGEAIEQFRSHRPDVTLMDLQMPEMNGIDALIAIRSEFPEARIRHWAIVLARSLSDEPSAKARTPIPKVQGSFISIFGHNLRIAVPFPRPHPC